MSRLLEWIQQIAVFYILMTVVEQLLPSGKYRKYVRLYLGLVFLLLVIAPAMSLTGLGASLSDAVKAAEEEIVRSDLRLEVAAGNEARYQMILTEYQGMIREQATGLVAREGYFLQSLEVEFVEDTAAADFGRIRAMYLVITNVPALDIQVAPIIIGESDQGEDVHPVMQKIQADLAAEYEVHRGQIHIQLK